MGKTICRKKSCGGRGTAVLFRIFPLSFLILLFMLCLTVFTALAQEPERLEVDGSALAAGQPFRFTITVNSEELLSFAESETQLTAVLCPIGDEAGECQTLSKTEEGEDNTIMRIVFTAEALPAAGDYMLDVAFSDPTGTFASQSAAYLLKGVRPAAEETAEPAGTPQPAAEVTETAAPEITETAEPVIDVSMTVKPIAIIPEFLDADGIVLRYGDALYVNEPYTLQLRADSPMNDSVAVEAALPSSFLSAPLDPESECLEYMNAEGTALVIPGSRWSVENDSSFRCELRYNDRAWLTSDPIVISINATGTMAEETYEMAPLRWTSYPTNITQHAATHQAQIYDSRGNLLCSDTVSCGMFYSDELYVLTYRFPSEWGALMPSGKSFRAEITWPSEWAGAIRQAMNTEAAAVLGNGCVIDDEGKTYFDLTENPTGRYSASCSFFPGAVQQSGQSSIQVHFTDNAYAVRDLNIGLSPVIVRGPVLPTIPAEPLETQTPEASETVIPEIEISMTVKPVSLTPSIVDESGNSLIYGSTMYVGEPYYLQIASDSLMNDSVFVNIELPASLINSPLDPQSECLSYQRGDSGMLSIPGSRWNEGESSVFRCELRFTDAAWLTANPLNFTISSSGIPADETFEMSPLSWNYYPVNISKFAATHQVQVSDSRGTLICSDNVACGAFNADDVYTLTYKIPADWGAALPSGKSFSIDLRWPEAWGMGLQMAQDQDLVAQFGTVCEVGSDGVTHLDLQEVSTGRYSASCTFSPSVVSTPVQAAAVLHLNDNSYQVNDLNVYLPGTIYKQQAVLSPSLTMQITETSAQEEQIHAGSIPALYRTTVNMPNNNSAYDAPALYTLKAQIEGVSPIQTPQWGDRVRVTWGVLDALAATGDLPFCLTPDDRGYALGTLTQTGDGIWQAECSFRFPLSMPENTPGDALRMELVSGMYSTTATVSAASQPFSRKTLTVNLDVPEKMVMNTPMEIHASLSDETGGLSDYTRAVIAQTGASLYSDWTYNYATGCQGLYDLAATGEAGCPLEFNGPTDSASYMHFSLESAGLADLFNVVFRPAADIYVPQVSSQSVMLTPSLVLQMSADSSEAEQINGGWLGTLYRTSGYMPNASMSSSDPARYTLRAKINGVYPDSLPQDNDAVVVKWNLLDEMARDGSLPVCLTPLSDGYRLGSLEQSGQSEWTASCSFYFPQTLSESFSAGAMSMQLESAAYQAAASVNMNGSTFKRENLYIGLDIPEHMLIRQMTEFRVKVSDDSGSISEYTRAVMNAEGAVLRSDWIYNYVTTCQGLFDLDAEGNSVCSALFETPVSGDSTMYFRLESPAIENLFNVTFRPSAEVHIAEVSNPSAELSVKLFHAGTEMPLPASSDDVFHVGEDYQFQFYLTPDPEFMDVLNAVSVDNEGLVLDWYEPLRIHWGMLPGGEKALNFYRDGGNFIARYDFSFDEGGLPLDGILSQLVVECWIDNWDIHGVNDMYPIQLPSAIDRKPVTLTLGSFTDAFGVPVSDVFVDRTVEFDVTFSGLLTYFDANRLRVGYEANGIQNPVDCFPDYESGTLHCSFEPQCTDFTYDEYPSVCGTGLSLFAEYEGDQFNESAAAQPKVFNVKRGEIYFVPAEDISLNKTSLYKLESVSDDMTIMDYAVIQVNGWNVDSFLMRDLTDQNGKIDQSYPVAFRYTKSGSTAFDDTLLRLNVYYQTGSYSMREDKKISIKPTVVTDDTVMFDLDFGSMQMMDDGRTVREALAEAVAVTGLEIIYPGSPLYGPSSARYEAEDLTFALKVASVLDMEVDISMPGTILFGGAAGAELMNEQFTVYCSQLYQALQCSAEPPLDVFNEQGEPMLSEVVPDGCWGRIQTKVGIPRIYVNNSVFPQCYLAGWDSYNRSVVIAGDF